MKYGFDMTAIESCAECAETIWLIPGIESGIIDVHVIMDFLKSAIKLVLNRVFSFGSALDRITDMDEIFEDPKWPYLWD
jgi:hypothetical protein